jgi:hypothetical protein
MHRHLLTLPTSFFFFFLHRQVRVLIEAFKHFVENQWTFDNRNVRSIYQMIRPEERAAFELDLTDLDWVRYSELFCFGLLRYTMKSPLLPIKQRDMKHFSVSHDILNPFRHTLSYKVMPDVDIIRVRFLTSLFCLSVAKPFCHADSFD